MSDWHNFLEGGLYGLLWYATLYCIRRIVREELEKRDD